MMKHFKKPDLQTISGVIVAIQILSGIILLQIFVIFILHATREDPKYYAVDKNEDRSRIYGLSQPNVSTSALLRWATLAATSSHTLNFADYEQELDKLKEFYTENGYDSYLETIAKTKFVEEIVQKKLIVSAVSHGTTVIVSEGTLGNGTYEWIIQVPLLLTYQGASEMTQKKIIVSSMTINTVSPKESDRGIGIEQFLDIPMG